MRCWRMRLLAPCQQAICVLAEFSRTLLKHGIIRTVNRFHRASGGFFGVLGVLARAYAFSAPTRLLTSQFMTVQSVLRPPPPAAPTPVPAPAQQIGRASCRERVCQYV